MGIRAKNSFRCRISRRFVQIVTIRDGLALAPEDPVADLALTIPSGQ